MKINRNGITRIVIELERIVIKIPNFLYQWDHFLVGLLSNIREYRTWNYSENKHLLCPVIWCSWGGWILIMQKAEGVSWGEINLRIFTEAGLDGDDKEDNYGLINGRVVKIDYGHIT